MTLTMTPAASTVVKTLVAQNPEVEDGGLRIEADSQAGTDFAVAIAPEPQPTDAVVESDGAKIFLGENAAPILEDKVLDAQVDDQGAVRFAIGAQEA
ncbi:iron-sulfur cluster biosynthesis family protein [Homoserinibacter sp. YIM 151385]|uniref:iron-sulfur cluster biosynthesis family protein n=1 Tax=Homoserinibacter sp. YIM 151385 TaxID=2985506 RepID=UPI0022F10D91|nr:iron-sulfur cluster biosynthesis family protein [Homoserinibacter sp. YIM 151385]WBU37895.1 Fe-S cluster assembly protein HesB [Homoserinibacter sp. YIM 151385]